MTDRTYIVVDLAMKGRTSIAVDKESRGIQAITDNILG
jgi:hypothetical protein